jgi:xanthine dehydrogenase accessory factor
MQIVTTTNSASLYQLLQVYERSPGEQHWFAATVVTRFKSSYRKPGAMMLINPLGQGMGLISGGCLESHICLQARKADACGRAAHIVYDSADEDNIAAELGIGCNGSIGILVQELGSSHRDILLQLLQRMRAGQISWLLQCYSSPNSADMNALALLDENNIVLATATNTLLPGIPVAAVTKHQLLDTKGQHWSLVSHSPPVNLWLVGGGVDAIPVASMAVMLGWRVTVVDHRVSHAREKDFSGVEKIIRQKPEEFQQTITADAVIIMSHNLSMDAAWLKLLQHASNLKYIGLLGPAARKEELLSLAGLAGDSSLAGIIHGPMGFDIGGDLPTSVALSVLSQCHQIMARHQCL